MARRPGPAESTSRTRRPKGDGTIYYDRSRRRWVGQLMVAGSRRKIVGTTKAQVAERLRELATIDAGGGGVDRAATVGAVLADWRTHAAPNRTSQPATLDAYDWAVARWTKALGRRKVADLRPGHIEAALRRMADEGLHHGTLVKLRSVLNMAMKRAVAHRVVPYNPVVGAEVPTGTPRPVVEPILTVDEVVTLQAALAGHDWEGLYLLMLTGGLRPGEAAAVCADAVDLDAGLVEVKRTRKLRKGRGELGDQLKTKGSHRTVDLPSWTVDALRRRIDELGATGPDLLYPDARGGVLTPGTVADVLADVLADADLPVVSPKQLRHTHATLLVDAGVPLVKVQDRLGHADLRMLLATYRHRPEVATGADAMPAPSRPTRHLRAVGD